MVSFRIKFILTIVNILVISLLFNYVPASSMVFLSILPALVFGIMSRRFFLVLFAFILAVIIAGLMVSMFVFPLGEEVGESIDFVVYLYLQIFPYQTSLNIVNILGIEALLGVSLFIFVILIAGWMIRLNTFKIMIVFSYFIMVFTSIYLVLNIFLYLFPPLRVMILANEFLRYILAFFYGILPLIVLTLSLLFLETILSYRERQNMKKDVNTIAKKVTNSNTFYLFIRAISALLIVIFVIILIVLGIII